MNPVIKANWTAQSPYEKFFDFIAPESDRFTVLLKHIKNIGLNLVIIPIEGNRHFFIFPPAVNLKLSAGDLFPFSGQSPVVLTAHYDRIPGSPGANDNSAAVFQLLKAAIILSSQKTNHWIIIFTDKEELQNGEGIQKQGSFSLAKKLKKWGLGNARVFNFDASGTGETFVISTTADYLLRNQSREGLQWTRIKIDNLREHVLTCARTLNLKNLLLFPIPFSDDAGFLRGGIPVQTITMLPAAEASSFASLLQIRPEFADMVIAGSVTNAADRQLVPETWRCINRPTDNHIRLTPEHYEKVVRFAVELCRW